MIFELSSIADTHHMAQKISKQLKAGDVIALYGDLGAGKTTFSRELIHNITGDTHLNVTSPTFNLLQIYDAGNIEIWHMDLYRIGSIEEALELGIEDAIENNVIMIIEWPDVIQKWLPENTIKIQFEWDVFSDKRTAKIDGV